MRRKVSLLASRRPGFDYVEERLILGNAAQTACTPFSQIVLNPPVARLSEQTPRLPGGPWHHRDMRELLMRVLRAISSAQGLYKADDLPALFEPRLHHRQIDQVRQQRIGSDDGMGARSENANGFPGERRKELLQRRMIVLAQDSEARYGASLAAVEGWRDSPYAAPAGAQLLLFRLGELLQPVGGIGDDRMNGICRAALHPLERVGVDEIISCTALLALRGLRVGRRPARRRRGILHGPSHPRAAMRFATLSQLPGAQARIEMNRRYAGNRQFIRKLCQTSMMAESWRP